MKKIGSIAAGAVLVLSMTTAAFAAAPSAQVYFENDLNESGAVNVYVDGQQVFTGSFSNSTSDFAQNIAPGTHQVVVTPSYAAPGQQDLASGSIDVAPGGVYTLDLGLNTDALGVVTGDAVSLNAGAPLVTGN